MFNRGQRDNDILANGRIVERGDRTPFHKPVRQVVSKILDPREAKFLKRAMQLRADAIKRIDINKQGIEKFWPHDCSIAAEPLALPDVTTGAAARTRLALASGASLAYPPRMDHADRIKRLRFRAWHRGTREADYMIGGFFDRYHSGWTAAETDWFEALIEEDDVDIMAWALRTLDVPEEYRGDQMTTMQRLDYVDIPR